MSDLKELRAWTGFGTSLNSAYILAAHPEEELTSNGLQKSTTRRTLVLRLNNKTPEFVEALPVPLARAWCSTNGTAYCTTILRNYIYTLIDGQWEQETFSKKNEDIYYVWGFGGKTHDEDIVYLCANGSIFVRKKGKWKEIVTPPGIGKTYYLHGITASEVYICTDGGMLLWDGKTLSAVEGPEGDNPKSLLVLSDHEIVAARKYLNHWSEVMGWKRVPTEYKTFRSIMALGDEVFAGTPKAGVIRIYPGSPSPVTEKFNCIRLCSFGDSILAIGKTCSYLYYGNSWNRLQLPMCRPGDIPN